MFVPSSRACHILQLRVWFEAATRRTFQLEPSVRAIRSSTLHTLRQINSM
jgi:hypothetical protein